MRIVICDGSNSEQKKYYDIFCSLAKKHDVKAEFAFYVNGKSLLFNFGDTNFMDVLFIDAVLPDMSGIDAARRLRDLGYKGEIVFIRA